MLHRTFRPKKNFFYLVFDHELMALHHDFKLVPPGLEAAQLLHAPPSHRAQQLVLLLGLQEEGLDQRTLLGQSGVLLVHLADLLHALGTRGEGIFGLAQERVDRLQVKKGALNGVGPR